MQQLSLLVLDHPHAGANVILYAYKVPRFTLLSQTRGLFERETFTLIDRSLPQRVDGITDGGVLDHYVMQARRYEVKDLPREITL